ncbi:MAG: hypothetical protein KDA47_05560, partial [Planctomycetales bacterium]|nr:hypothetical protein [Planctomycetales bacterium]
PEVIDTFRASAIGILMPSRKLIAAANAVSDYLAGEEGKANGLRLGACRTAAVAATAEANKRLKAAVQMEEDHVHTNGPRREQKANPMGARPRLPNPKFPGNPPAIPAPIRCFWGSPTGRI